MDRERLAWTIGQARDRRMGIGRGGRGRYQEATAELADRLDIFTSHGSTVSKLVEAWGNNPASELRPDYLLSRMGEERPEAPWIGHAITELHNGFGPAGRYKLRHLGLNHVSGKAPLGTFVRGMMAAIYLDEMTLDQILVKVR